MAVRKNSGCSGAPFLWSRIFPKSKTFCSFMRRLIASFAAAVFSLVSAGSCQTPRHKNRISLGDLRAGVARCGLLMLSAPIRALPSLLLGWTAFVGCVSLAHATAPTITPGQSFVYGNAGQVVATGGHGVGYLEFRLGTGSTASGAAVTHGIFTPSAPTLVWGLHRTNRAPK